MEEVIDRSIGVFDSGIGGLTVLDELKKLLPNESFIYYSDSKNSPYGSKSEEELYKIVCNIVEKLISLDVKLIVIACNTATTRCMRRLRVDYPEVIFVGTVPAIKVACDHDYKNILVMATPSTIKSQRTYELINDNKKYNQSISLLSCDGLASLIEEGDQEKINNRLREIFNDYLDKDIDSIVLGCTHYPLIKDNIREFFKDVVLIDGSYGVAKEVKRQLESHDLLSKISKQTIKMIDSGKEDIL